MNAHPVYRALTLMYPRGFRDRYRNDLIQHHADLTNDRGPAAAWLRTGLDLIITVPRYHLETVMNPHRANNTLNALVAALAIAGLMAIVAIDSYVGAALLAAATCIAITQRSRLAQAIRVRDSDRRQRRLKMAALLTVVAAVDVAVGFADLGDEQHWGAKAVVYGAISYAAAGAAICYLIAGLLTRRTPPTPLSEPALS